MLEKVWYWGFVDLLVLDKETNQWECIRLDTFSVLSRKCFFKWHFGINSTINQPLKTLWDSWDCYSWAIGCYKPIFHSVPTPEAGCDPSAIPGRGGGWIRTLQVQWTGRNGISEIQLWASRTQGKESPLYFCTQAEHIKGTHHVIRTNLTLILRFLPRV